MYLARVYLRPTCFGAIESACIGKISKLCLLICTGWRTFCELPRRKVPVTMWVQSKLGQLQLISRFGNSEPALSSFHFAGFYGASEETKAGSEDVMAVPYIFLKERVRNELEHLRTDFWSTGRGSHMGTKKFAVYCHL